jgi:hypothetical protein
MITRYFLRERLMSGVPRPILLLALLPVLLGHSQLADTHAAKTWVGRHQEIEEYLKTADCVTLRWSAVKTAAQCVLRPGGPVARMAWRTASGSLRGFRESYKSEIAAYELDRLLEMDMVPPTVERQIEGRTGAAQQWVENVVDATDPTLPAGESRTRWASEQVRMTMFDNLIGNRDRNRRNMLRDQTWHLILIDHTRAFGVDSDLPHKMSAIDDAYWARIERLTRTELDAALRTWLDQDEIDAILARRARMRAEIKSRPN